MSSLKRFVRHASPYNLMLFLPFLLVLIFNYLPMFGIVLAFQNYLPGLGITHSQFVGLDNFKMLFQMPEFYGALRNTLIIAIQKIVWGLVLPVIFALMLNEVRIKWFNRTVQTLTFIPYFLSWVVLGGIMVDFLSPDAGMLNNIIAHLGLDKIYFLGNPKLFQGTMVVTDVWKNLGYNSIVYLAALMGIDEGLYEASELDGANRWQQTWHVTLPALVPFILLMTILSMGNVLNAGFDQVFNMYSPAVYSSGDIIDTLVYRMGMLNQQYSLSTAVGLFKSVVSGLLILSSYKLAERFTDYRIF